MAQTLVTITKSYRCMNIIKYDAELNVPDFSSDLKFEQKYIVFAGWQQHVEVWCVLDHASSW